MKRFFWLVGFFLLVLGIGKTQAAFQYSTDFNQLDRSFWLVFTHGGRTGPYSPMYDRAILQNGQLILNVTETDYGPELISKGIRVSPQAVVTVEWRAKVHYANEYFAGSVHFVLTNYDSFYDPRYGEQLHPADVIDSQGDKHTYFVSTVYYRNYVYNNYPPPRGGNSFGICGYQQCLVSTPVWDDWFTNKVEINFPEGKVKFWQNGAYIGEVPINTSLDLNAYPYLKVWFSPYGWWTGHSMALDYVHINVTETGVPGGGTSGDNCLPSFDDHSGILDLPAVQVGNDLYAARLQLTSVMPAPVFSLVSIEPSSCTPSSCLPTFDPATNVLDIPSVEVGGDRYAASLALVSVLPQVSFSLQAVDYARCSGGGGYDHGGGCVDCSCPDYAAAHPHECGQTGRLNFRIVWHDTNDVDLHVQYLMNNQVIEEISYNNEVGTETHGQLDVDANAGCGDVTNNPVENIYFDSPPIGTYRVIVCGYEQCDPNRPSSQVTVQALVDGQVIWQRDITVSQWDETCQTVYEYPVTMVVY